MSTKKIAAGETSETPATSEPPEPATPPSAGDLAASTGGQAGAGSSAEPAAEQAAERAGEAIATPIGPAPAQAPAGPAAERAETGASEAVRPFPIVGLGASAGGLEAFEMFLREMPADCGMGFVLVQHLDPSHASILSEILQRRTAMPVIQVEEPMRVLPDRVYVIPPNRDMSIFHGTLLLSLPAAPRGQRLPIDAFFRSLAEDQGDNAAGIILSGTGTDGTLGLRAIHGAGGLCLVQEPADAKYDGMPSSAIRAGYLSQVMPVSKMPQALLDGFRLKPGRMSPTLQGTSPPGLNGILMLLRSGTGHDFSQYKKSTLGRRVERRMDQHGLDDMALYVRFLKEHPEELQNLFRELLINVTSFFRDPLAFAALKDEVLPSLLAERPEHKVLRIWVAGCATGEEAYSLAILLHEWMEEHQQDLKIQLYATDLDDEAIATARMGRYPPNIEQDVSPERLLRYFSKDDTGYRVRKEIRERVVFAVQSVIKDPPFTRLDLLSCRNLMIYLEPELQDRLIPAFHYALNPGGVLFLSPSEGVGSHVELFEPVNRRWKLYRAKPSMDSVRAVLSGGLSWTIDKGTQVSNESPSQPPEMQIAELAKRTLLKTFAPAAVVTDLQGNILYVHGDTGKFLRPAPGQPTHCVIDMAREGLQAELREAIKLATSQGLPTLHRLLKIRSNGAPLTVSLSVQAMPGAQAGSGVLLVSFQEVDEKSRRKSGSKPHSIASAAQLHVEELERELTRAKEDMSAMLEEQQASNEELKSTNEELQSTNEELQSTNEELETSKEELQSVNEEMVTVNTELQTKIDEMAGMQDDMKNLLDNMRLGTIFLDRQLIIRRFTRDAAKIYRLVGSDVGRPLADFRSAIDDDRMIADAQTVLHTLEPIEREVCTASGIWYLTRIQPYRTVDNEVDGVVLSFSDASAHVQAIAARKAHALAEVIVDTVPVPLVVLDAGLRVVSANRAYFDRFGGTSAETIGRKFIEIGSRQWDDPDLRLLLETALAREHSVERQVLPLTREGQGARQLRLSARCVDDPSGTGNLVLLALEPDAPAAG